MDAHRQRESLASIALGLMQQIAPGVFDQLPEAARRGVLASLEPIDAAAEERSREAAAEAVLAAAALHRATAVPVGVGADGIAFAPVKVGTPEADEQAARADECLAMAQSQNWAYGRDQTSAGTNAIAQVAAAVSLAHSAREACIVLRAIAATLERRDPMTTICNDNGGE